MRRTSTVSVLLGMGLALAACGSSASGTKAASTSGAPAGTSVSAAASVAASVSPPEVATTGAAPTTAAATAGGGSDAGSDFCVRARAQQADTAKAEAALAGGNTADLKDLETKGLAELKSFAGEAPASIKGDVQTLVSADEQFINALTAVNFDITKVSPSTLSAFEAPAVQTATKHLVTYLSSSCGISVPTDLPSAGATAP